MKKLILLSIFIVGCSKTSTSAPSCTELTKAYVDAASAYSADPTNNDLCNSYVAALQKLVDAGCSGYTQAAVNLLQNTCNNSTNPLNLLRGLNQDKITFPFVIKFS